MTTAKPDPARAWRAVAYRGSNFTPSGEICGRRITLVETRDRLRRRLLFN
ncbi:MAG TPA: hypothetical protein VGO22_05505 [Pseudorhizobium sp.]|nr:hypothetical protein [Pseudorhizobium sp.]